MSQETDEVRLSLKALRAARASKKSLVQGHVMKAPCLSDLGEESGELEGSRPSSVGSRPASTQPSVLELGEARSRRSVYQAGQPYSLASASMSMSRLVYDRLQEIRSAVLLNKEEEDIDSNIEWDDIDDQSEISSQRPSWHKEIVLLLLGPGKKQLTALCTLYTVHCTLPTKNSTLHTVHYTLKTAHCTPHTAHCTLKTAHCTLHTAH